MTNPASEDIKDLLVSAGVGTFAATSGWGIYVGTEPAEPHTVVTLVDTSGSEPNPRWLIDEPHLQARVRGAPNDQPGAYTKAREVLDQLLGLPQQTVNGTVYVGIWALSEPYLVEYDSNRRPVYTVNFRMVREPSSGTNRTAL